MRHGGNNVLLGLLCPIAVIFRPGLVDPHEIQLGLHGWKPQQVVKQFAILRSMYISGASSSGIDLSVVGSSACCVPFRVIWLGP